MENVSYNNNGTNLIIYVSDRIDTTNANEVEASINSIIEANPFNKLTLDIENLEYISSAGLRVVLKLKKSYSNFEVINASHDVYDIFDMTGFSSIIDIKKAYRHLLVDGLSIVGKGAKGTVYQYNDDTIVKVYKDPNSIKAIENERRLAQKAFILGIPTAISYDIVKVGDTFGSVFELLPSKTLSSAILNDMDNFDKYANIFATILKTIHSTEDKDHDTPDVKVLILKWLMDLKGVLKDEDLNKLNQMVDEVPNSTNLLHMDYHTNNVLMQNGEALLIDMDTLSHGNKIFELANIYAPLVGFKYISHELIENFLDMKVEVTERLYEKFFDIYFNDHDDVVYDKVALLGLVRTLRHAAKRKDSIPNYDEVYNTLESKIHELLQHIDNLII